MYTKEYFQKIRAEEAEQASRLCDILVRMFSPKHVIDWGCATGLYLAPFEVKYGIETFGVDYSEEAVKMRESSSILHADMRNRIITRKYDLALCLETLEHIEELWEKTALDNVADSSDLVILTVAQPGQGGEGHYNMKPKEYWKKRFEEKGFTIDEKATQEIIAEMRKGYHMGWFVNNLMVLRRGDYEISSVGASTHTN